MNLFIKVQVWRGECKLAEDRIPVEANTAVNRYFEVPITSDANSSGKAAALRGFSLTPYVDIVKRLPALTEVQEAKCRVRDLERKLGEEATVRSALHFTNLVTKEERPSWGAYQDAVTELERLRGLLNV